ncbi:MAG: hypothetical protein ABI305_12760 [Tepidiformaceae bacterium]
MLLSGVIASLVFGQGFLVGVIIPAAGRNHTAAELTSYYKSDVRTTFAALTFFALVAGCLTLAWFFTELRDQLPSGTLAKIGYAAAMIGLITVPIGAGIMGGAVAGLGTSGGNVMSGDVANAFAQIGLGIMLTVGMPSLAAAAFLFTLASTRAGLFPAWVTAVALVLAVITFSSYFWLPAYGFMLWVSLTGVYLGTRREAARTVSPVARMATA